MILESSGNEKSMFERNGKKSHMCAVDCHNRAWKRAQKKDQEWRWYKDIFKPFSHLVSVLAYI